MKIAVIGSRGIPNNYGGFEKFAERLSVELVKKGYDVWVSCENNDYQEELPEKHEGVNLFYFKLKPPSSHLLRNIYEFFYDAYSIIWATKNVDIIYMLGYSSAFLFFIPRIFNKELWVNPDGIEWKRSKFNPIIKFLLKWCEKFTTYWADRIIADSKEIKRYFKINYNIESHYISYGALKIPEIAWNDENLPEKIKEITLNPSYWLVVARLEPENNIKLIVEAYLNSNIEKPLIIVGNFSIPKYEKVVMDLVNKNPSKRVIFTGGIYDPNSLNMLRQNCFAYIHGHSVGGTNPSLLEIMSMETIVLAHKNPFNMEVCEDSAIYFEDEKDLRNKMEMVDENLMDFIHLKEKAQYIVEKNYSWDKIVEDYEDIINRVKI